MKLREFIHHMNVDLADVERGSWVDFTWLAILVASPVVGVFLLYFANVAWDRWMPW